MLDHDVDPLFDDDQYLVFTQDEGKEKEETMEWLAIGVKMMATSFLTRKIEISPTKVNFCVT